MAIKKTDCILLLTELQEKGFDTKDYITKVLQSETLPIDILKFINSKKQLDVCKFYEKVRKNYNDKKSDLYINIVKEIDDPQEVLTTLCALQLQIILFSKKVENKKLFFEAMRAKEITFVLDNYFKTFDITTALKLLRMYKADIKALESIK